MHLCLNIPEILQSIFDFVVTERGIDTPSIAALVNTCWKFHNIGVPMLWKEIFSPVLLVLTMPTDLWAVEKVPDDEQLSRFHSSSLVTFNRDVKPADWIRFDYYASFVKHMGRPGPISAGNVLYLDSQVDKIFKARVLQLEGKLLIPSLTSIVASSSELSYFHSYLSPKILSLCIDVHTSYHATLVPLFSEIPQLAHNLKHVTLSLVNQWNVSDGMMEEIYEAIEQLVVGLHQLESFRCNWLEMRNVTLAHLLTLPTFKSLHCRKISLPAISFNTVRPDPSIIANESNLRNLHPLGHLQKLTISKNKFSPREIERFFSSIKLPLQTFEIDASLSGPGRITVEDFGAALLSLSKHLSLQHLTQLTLLISIANPRSLATMFPGIPLTNLFPNIGTFETIEPLLGFVNLTHISIHYYMFELGDEDLIKLGKGWPNLQSLSLRGNIAAGAVARLDLNAKVVTLDGLFSFAAHCRHLNNLCMVVQCISAAIPYEPQELGRVYHSRLDKTNVWKESYVNNAFKSISLGDSELDNPDNVAELLRSAFPNLMIRRPLGWNSYSNWSNGWRQVAKLLDRDV